MRRKRLILQLFLSYLFITVGAIVAVSGYSSRALRQFYLANAAEDLEARVQLVIEDISRALETGGSEKLSDVCRELGERSNTRFTVVDSSGKVLGDSKEDPERMDNHADRPEIAAAIAGSVGFATRYSHTLAEDMMYVAVQVRGIDRTTTNVIRASIPMTALNTALGKIYWRIFVATLVVVIFAAAVSLIASRRISRPLEDLRLGAERFARGNLEHKLSPPDSFEIGGLADAMNQMAQELDEKIKTLIRQKHEEEAVLSSMIEAVVAVDDRERIIKLNGAAAEVFGIAESEVEGKSIQEIIRNPDLLRLVAQTLESESPIEGEIRIFEPEQRSLQAHGTGLRDTEGVPIGALVVLSDVTRLLRLERVRKEFVANVSHELKTPITAIRGFVDTLLDGALDDRNDAERFLKIMSRQADRLNSIIEDLLSLSRIEQIAEKGPMPTERVRIDELAASSIQACSVQAANKGIEIVSEVDESVQATDAPALLEQALTNLIDNATKYSDEGKKVWVSVHLRDGGLAIDVRDEGCGIAAEHLPRLFERFYRADKARSRELGGTGLGLAIVKHIAEAHGGSVSVQSEPGRGSTFTIQLATA